MIIFTGLFFLWLGTHWLITGAIAFGDRLQWSPTFVGLAVLAVGTDLPEIFVSVKAALLQRQGIESSGIITGNAIGSSISQITIILGVAALFMNFTLPKKDVLTNGLFLLSSILILLLQGWDGNITRWEGVVLLITYVIYYLVIVKQSAVDHSSPSAEQKISWLKIFTLMSGGFVLLIGSAHFVVENALLLAQQWGVAQSFVGIFLVGLGTSLPELAVSVNAALRKSAGLSVGNIIGSNVLDTTMPIGLGGVISTTRMDRNLLIFDLPLLFIVSLLTILLLNGKRGITRIEGALLVLTYVGYILIKSLYFENI